MVNKTKHFSLSAVVNDPLFRRWGILGTGLVGIIATLLGGLSGSDVATFLGLGVTTASLFLALVLSAIQSRDLSQQSAELTKQGKDLATLGEKVHQVLFNDVTLRVFYNIQENEKLSERMHKGNIDVKNGLGAAFRSMTLNAGETDFFGEFIAKRNIFIESGSTYAYLSLEINKYLNDKALPDWPRHTIFTNNILVFMVLVFQSRCWARLYPGTPAGQYGATYGRGYDVDTTLPTYRPTFRGVIQEEMTHFLQGAAQRTVAEQTLTNGLSQSDQYGVDVVLLAASKLHLTYGPHVGSEENVCFKQALLQYCRDDGNQVPMLLCLDASKIESEQEEVGEQCRMLYPLDQGNPYFAVPTSNAERATKTSDVGKDKNERGFEMFASDIADGRIILFVGYDDKLRKEVALLEERLTSLNANLGRSSKPLVSWRIAQAEKVNMLVVYAETLQHIPAGKWKLAREIQRAIATRVCS